MDLIQLKMPPEKLTVLIESVERDIGTTDPDRNTTELQSILNWLRYRRDRWNAHRPGTTAD